MDTLIHCSHCKQTVRRRTAPGRRPDYCSTQCRKNAELAERRKARSFEALKKSFYELGEDEVRRFAADDPEFTVQLIELAETYLKPADGRERATEDSEALALVFRKPRSFTVLAAGHDTPLPPSTDIDDAEASGDWRPMVEAALKGMTWQLANGYVPDLSEWS